MMKRMRFMLPSDGVMRCDQCSCQSGVEQFAELPYTAQNTPPNRGRAMTRHPLEPLDAAEVRHAVQLLRDTGKVTPTTRFISVSLKEPPKARVHAGDMNLPREAFAVLFDNGANSCYEATVA